MPTVDFLHSLADAASDVIMPHFRQPLDVDNKETNGFDPVTVADREAERAMRALIEMRHPDHGILGEEFGTKQPDADTVWILDPIDGTRAFISGLPTWGVLIGHKFRGEATLGMMCQPFTKERFWGDGQTATHEGPGGELPLRTRACPKLEDATLFTTTPALFEGAMRATYDRIEGRARLARYGADCYAYCMVAAGHADIVLETGLAPYDVAALIPIVEGAGGRVTTWDGSNAVDGGSIIATGDPALHEAVLQELNT
ncbi:MAG: histidinol-phosphatase [Pseudomonadota bacterium]